MDGPREAIAARAREEGFDAVGFAPADIGERPGDRLDAFTRQGLHGDMAWLAETVARRRHPQAMWPEARSIVVLGQNYGPGDDPLALLDAPERGNVSVYARGRDYHDVMKKRLRRVARWLGETYDCEVKIFVDTAPVLEKAVAERAGLGWQGKHTNLVSREFGSWLFLGSVFTTLALDADAAHADNCGSCRACLDVCPTDAFPQPYLLDARRCISYLTIEHKGPIAPEFRAAIGNRIYGCDDCLAVCPWNKYAQASREVAFAARAELAAPRLGDLLALDDAAFRAVFAGSPVKRIGRDRFLRNVLIAAGNSGDGALVPAVEARLDDAAAIVRGMAVWALSRLLAPEDFARRAARHLPDEADGHVRDEWRRGAAAARLGGMTAPEMKTYYEHGFGTLEAWPVRCDAATLERLLRDVFERYWADVTFGPLIQGAAYEFKADGPPEKIGVLDGYLTVDFGGPHFHLCIGEQKGLGESTVDADLARHRRTARAEFFRRINRAGAPDVWGLRLFNGAGEQQITVLLPSPFLSRELALLETPDWSRLDAWDALRARHLGLDPDPRDRTGTGLSLD